DRRSSRSLRHRRVDPVGVRFHSDTAEPIRSVTSTKSAKPEETPQMRRSTLSTKLFAAALPLVLAVAALLAFTVRNDLRDVQQAENGAELGRVWTPLIGALSAIATEVADARGALTTLADRRDAIDAADGVTGNLGAADALADEREAAAQYDATTPPLRTSDLAEARSAADTSLDQLVAAVDRLDGADS